jgi:hypothetical protein
VRSSNLGSTHFVVPDKILVFADVNSLLNAYGTALADQLRDYVIKQAINRWNVLMSIVTHTDVFTILAGTKTIINTMITQGTTQLVVTLTLAAGVTLKALSVAAGSVTFSVGTNVLQDLCQAIWHNPLAGPAQITAQTACPDVDLELTIDQITQPTTGVSIGLACQDTEYLLSVLDGMVIAPDVKQGLTDKLTAAVAKMSRAETTSGRNLAQVDNLLIAARQILGAFKNQVQAQAGKSILASDADILASWASGIAGELPVS